MLPPVILSLALLIGQSVRERVPIKALQTFNVGDVPCELAVVDRERTKPDEKIVVTCNHLNLLTYDLGQARVTKIEFADPSTTDSVRAFLMFERGITATLVVFNVSSVQDKTTAKIVYEHSSQNAAETLENGDVILEHVKRRFEAGSAILPGGTNVYRWQDGRYTFIEGFQWNQRASWTDRYCILYKPESCPAERTKTRVLDEYEH